jgi:hypothetical protein
MKRLIVALAVAVVAATAHSEPKLLGKWKSDGQKSVAFAKERAKLEDKTLLFLEQLLGNMTLTFTRESITSEMPDVQTQSTEGVKSKLNGFSERHPYKVIGLTESQVAISTVEAVTGRKAIVVFNFDGKDAMWVYVGSPAMPETNIREYFVRIK